MGGRGGEGGRGLNLGGSTGLKGLRKGMPDSDLYSGYAQELTYAAGGDDTYNLRYNGGNAFADIDLKYHSGSLYINVMGSTGNRAGTEMLARLAEEAKKSGKSLSWSADDENAVSYYQHVGAGKYASGGRMYTAYTVPHKDLEEFIKRLRRRR